MALVYLSFGGASNVASDWLILAYSTAVAFLFALVGLLVIGQPLTYLIKSLAISRWSILVGAVIGGVVGRTITGLMGLDPGLSMLAIFQSLGFTIGGSTGLFWVLLVRKRLVEVGEDELL